MVTKRRRTPVLRRSLRKNQKRHKVALICLARRRVSVIYDMLRDRQPNRAPATDATG